MKIRKNLYKTARVLNDINAVNKNKVGKRVGRRAVGSFFALIMKLIFK